MAPNYKIAIIQMQQEDAAVEENFAKAESYIRKAASQGAHLAVLPEYHLTSWCPDHPDFLSATLKSATYLPRYQALASELNINIVPGTIVEPMGPHNPPQPPQLANKSYWISSTGAILASYQKKNLWHPERPHLTPGPCEPPHSAFDTPLLREDGSPLRAGILICWDLAFPEAFRALLADGADMVIVPSWWRVTDTTDVAYSINPDGERVFLESVTVARACENAMAVVFCNEGGMSQAAMPIVGTVGGWKGEVGKEEMGVVDVDFGVLGVAEGNYKVRGDMKGEGWVYGYTLWTGDKRRK